MGVKSQYRRKGIKQKSAAKKRFRITGKGNIKYFPSQLRGKKKMIYKLGAVGADKHLAAVFPGKGYQKTMNMTMKRKYRETDDLIDEFVARAPIAKKN
jgi:hypothetical protein